MSKAFLKTPLGRLAYTDTGPRNDGEKPGAPVLLFLHGRSTVKELWAPVLAHLDTTMRAVTVDLPGAEADQQSVLLHQLCAHLGLRRIVLVGHGTGAVMGYLAQSASRYSPQDLARVERVVLLSPETAAATPLLRRIARSPLGKAALAAAAPLCLWVGIRGGLVHGAAYCDPLRSAMRTATADAPARSAFHHRLGQLDPTPEALSAALQLPVLLITGRRDRYLGLGDVKQLARALPQVRLAVVDGSGHYLALDAPVEVGRLISDFLMPRP